MNNAQAILQMMYSAVASNTQQMLQSANASDVNNNDFKKMIEEKSEEFTSSYNASENSNKKPESAQRPNDKVQTDSTQKNNTVQKDDTNNDELQNLQDTSQIQMIDLSLVIPNKQTGELNLQLLSGEKLAAALAQKIVPENTQQTMQANAGETQTNATQQQSAQTQQSALQTQQQTAQSLQQTQNQNAQSEQGKNGNAANGGESAKDDALQLTANDASQQPVFTKTEFVPVKVGDGQMQQPAQTPTTDISIANTIINASNNGTDQVTIKLTPEHLGNLVIDIVRSPTGVISIVLTPETEAAAKMLSEHSTNIAGLLQNGTNEVKVQVVPPQESESMMQNPNKDAKDGTDNRQEQENQQKQSSQDFINKLRLGLVDSTAQSA